MKIADAKAILHCPDAYGGIYGKQYGQALATAFKSFEAWENVKAEIEQKYALYKFNFQGFSMSIVADCLAIIDKHLQEVENA